MTANTKQDYNLKFSLLNDLFTVIDMEGKLTGNELQIGGWDLIYKNGLVRPFPQFASPTNLGWKNDRYTQLCGLYKDLLEQQQKSGQKE